jgi:hypothetical protein
MRLDASWLTMGRAIEVKQLEPDQKKPSRRVRFKAVENASNIWFEQFALRLDKRLLSVLKKICIEKKKYMRKLFTTSLTTTKKIKER